MDATYLQNLSNFTEGNAMKEMFEGGQCSYGSIHNTVLRNSVQLWKYWQTLSQEVYENQNKCIMFIASECKHIAV